MIANAASLGYFILKMRKIWIILLLFATFLLLIACREESTQDSIKKEVLDKQKTSKVLLPDSSSIQGSSSTLIPSPSPRDNGFPEADSMQNEDQSPSSSILLTPSQTRNANPSPTPSPTTSPSATAAPSATATTSATASTLEGAVQHLDTPEKLSAFLLREITFTDHGGCLSYWPDVFYQKREGNCKDYSTFASYVLAQHGYNARRIVYTYYRNGIRLGHEVAAYEIGAETWIMSNGHISGPFASLTDYFLSLTHLDYVTLLCIKPPGGVTCCNP